MTGCAWSVSHNATACGCLKDCHRLTGWPDEGACARTPAYDFPPLPALGATAAAGQQAGTAAEAVGTVAAGQAAGDDKRADWLARPTAEEARAVSPRSVCVCAEYYSPHRGRVSDSHWSEGRASKQVKHGVSFIVNTQLFAVVLRPLLEAAVRCLSLPFCDQV